MKDCAAFPTKTHHPTIRYMTSLQTPTPTTATEPADNTWRPRLSLSIGDLNIAPSQLPHVQVMRVSMRHVITSQPHYYFGWYATTLQSPAPSPRTGRPTRTSIVAPEEFGVDSNRVPARRNPGLHHEIIASRQEAVSHRFLVQRDFCQFSRCQASPSTHAKTNRNGSAEPGQTRHRRTGDG